ncbi:MAG TPA: nicotinate phosphoribosyltransferase [Candidatus Onthenecus intestinigallinarum]|uniref:Nicotinate phosphoribosyltransferase n=1 Tax=Candidatus Onthenecus intestinigallinarum TaxID=2840875 RepID=A0A9D1CQY9_9FIRM|nr:nicotinate phosphoribosyltransferase [Candidatus Onthenecus intestinigallinarum]
MRNLTMMTDLYELTMMNGYWRYGMAKNVAVFDLFYRKQGDETAHAVAAGLEQAIEYVRSLHFSTEDIAYLRSLNTFDEGFLNLLKNFRFTGDIDAVPEGTIVFPTEPIVRVCAPMIEAQLVETALLNIINHQTLIATKASRVVQAAQGDGVLEFGLRRAQGPDAGIYGARASIIGGCVATSNVLTGQMYDIPVRGTHAHSWVMSFGSELEAFRAYAEVFPHECLLLVDTYDTLKSGVPNAITVFKELRARGIEPNGIRLDSGDLAYLSRTARKMLDDAGFPNARIFASGDLDEEVIWDLKAQGAAIDVWGVGTRMITSQNNPALGGVYKLAAEEVNGELVPRIKISENPAKITNPGKKKVLRIYSREDRHALADLIALHDEVYDASEPLTIFDPENTWKRMTLTDYTLRELLVPIFRGGEQVYRSPDLHCIAAYARDELDTFWSEYKRLHRPQRYKVDLSQRLYDLKQSLLARHGH